MVAALIMLGRTVARGNFRLVFSFFVPQWLQVWSTEIPGGPADPAAGTGWEAQARPILRRPPGTVAQLPGSQTFQGPARRDGTAQ